MIEIKSYLVKSDIKRRIEMINKKFTLIILFLFFAPQFVAAQVPETISYQGILTDNEGDLISDGNYDLHFNLYDSFSEGNKLWSESQTILINKGVFNTILGEFIPINLSFDKQYWLGISINSDPELTPRIKLTTSPYSMNSRQILGGKNIFPSDGNVGIGIKTPNEKLEVAGTIRSTTGGFMFPDGTIQTTATTGNLEGNLRISEDSDGFVGIDIKNENTGSNSSEGIYFNNEDGSLAGIILNDDDHVYASQMNIFNNRPSGSINFSTQGVKNLTLSNSGNIGIGTTFPEQKLHVKGLARFDLGGGQINISTPGDNPGIITFVPNGHRRDIVFNDNGLKLVASSSSSTPTNGIHIKENGYVGINLGLNYPNNILEVLRNSTTDPIADAWTTYSSKRWKTNIKPIENALELVQRLEGVEYDWKENGKHDIGLIAEEVGNVIPEIVAYEDNGLDAKSVDYARIVAILIEGMKEQQIQINSQINTIRKLEERITNLENK
jgi:hypothetical protein